MKPNQRKMFMGALAGVLAAALLTPRLAVAAAIDPDADRIFRASCDYLAGAKAFGVKVEVWKDVVLPQGVKLQTSQALDIQELRPDNLRVEVNSPRNSRGFWYRKKSLTMLDHTRNLYGVMEVPGSLDKAVDALEDRFGIEIPLADVLVADPYRNMMENTQTLADLGLVTVLGVRCHHLVFTGTNADCQVWIADGARPLPKKIVINLKTLPGSPQITQIFSDWDLVTPVSESVFTFVPPDGAGKITVNARKADEADDQPAAATPETSKKP